MANPYDTDRDDGDPATTPGRRASSIHRDEQEKQVYGDELLPNAQIGNYIIEALTSRGGFATIYKARHARIGRIAALKVLHSCLLQSTDMLRRFLQEAQLVNFVRHPNIVDIYEFGELTDGRPYFVMEWLAGRNLEQELRVRGRIAIPDAIAIMEDLGAAMAAAHRLGVIHRDLKASNIVAVPAGKWFAVKLVDFGIAKLIDSTKAGEELTSKGMVLGTPWTMAPEQVLGQPVDARTDIYAMGILLYQMVSGNLPFRADTPSAVQVMQISAEPPKLMPLSNAYSALNEVIQKCLEKDKERRYGSVEELLFDLRRIDPQASGAESKTVKSLAIALHIEARVAETGSLEDAIISESEAILAEARRACANVHLAVSGDAPTSVLGVALLPGDEESARLLRQSVLSEALDLEKRLRLVSTHVQTLVGVHVGSVIARVGSRVVKFLGGELLSSGAWAAQFPPEMVTVTPAALAGVEEFFTVEQLPGNDGAFRLISKS